MEIITLVIAFVIAITIHEASHAWMSDRLGDPTARLMGRLSLNPLKHLDIYGTVLVPLFLILARSPFVFGWAKPVMFDPYNLKNPKKDGALIALSGPASNLILAIILSIIFHFIYNPFFPSNLLLRILIDTISINVTLAIFNLVPIHPLDGGKVFIGLLPSRDAVEAENFLNRYGLIILIFLIFPFFGKTSPLNTVISPIINFILKLLIPGASFV
jgi:Zn-dependent protease